MSKSRGNVVEPWDVIDRHGADAFRWYYFTSKQPWDGYRFSVETVGESVRQFMLTLWNAYAFLVLYANAGEVEFDRSPAGLPEGATDLDRWILSRLQATTEIAIDRLDDYDTTLAGRAIAAFVDELSNWYVRRSRRRFWEEDRAAFATMQRCLVEVSKLAAPLVPFVTDEMYENLDGGEPSVHLCDYPEPDASLARRGARVADAGGPRRRRARAGRPRSGPAEGAPAARRGGGRRGRPRAGGDRALPGAGARRAQRQAAPLRVGGRGAGAVGAEAQLPDARPPVRQEHAARGERGGRPRRAERRGAAARGGRGGRLDRRRGALAGLGRRPARPSAARRATSSSARERTRWRSTSSSTTTCVARASPARWCTASRPRARRPGSRCRTRIALTLAGDAELIDAARAHEPYVAGETLASELSFDGADASERRSHRHDRRPRAPDRGGAGAAGLAPPARVQGPWRRPGPSAASFEK